jgi:hypothetical protein
MQTPNRPIPRYHLGQMLWTQADRVGRVADIAWRDGAWAYGLDFGRQRLQYVAEPRLFYYAEHELEAAR